SLVLCDNPPGFRTLQELKKRFPKIDATYRPVVQLPLPREPMNFSGCDERVSKTVDLLRDIRKGNIVFVGHDSSIASVIWNLAHKDVYPGQATITVFKEVGGKVEMIEQCSTKHLKATNKTRFTG
uniref:Histidine phosphatase family protein n=2 Tax=Bursaphelenchus xylophilus TaxID=6326 RepID=A0A1I7SK82_BURXY